MKNLLINDAVNKLNIKLKNLDINSLDISEYNKKYLLQYLNYYDFYMSLYKQLLSKAINKLSKPITEAVFVDYGGGCGILSFLAKEIGFKTVVYNDIYAVSASDANTIAKKINITISYCITGDIEKCVNEINTLNIKPDLICSFDVLEHIYNLRSWIKTITEINNPFDLLFITSANSKNPFINKRLKKIHHKAEYIGFTKTTGWKQSDIHTSYLEERKKIINAKFSGLTSKEINMLAANSRGLIKEDIEQLVETFLQTGKLNYIPHSTNTCDPYTGNWAENLINIGHLKNIAITNNLFVEVTNTYYGYSKNKLLNLPKRFINAFIKIAGKNNLFFSPMYVLEISKK